jgi:predicted nucleotidyltransferase
MGLDRVTDMSHYPDDQRPGDTDIELTLAEAVAALEEKRLPYLLMGGAGSVTFGRPRLTDDIDLFVRPEDARSVLDVLAAVGFETAETDLAWLHKAFRRGVLVDVIYRSAGEIYLDREMLRRGRRRRYRGTEVLLMCPEDLVVIKAIAASEDAIRHWYDALALIAYCELDWDYVLGRARQHGPRRLLSLLLYAESDDLPVPAEVVESLVRTVHPRSLGEQT